MRRPILMLVALTTIGVAVYRHRCIERWEQELAIGRYADAPPE